MRKTIQFLQLAFILLLATACAETSPFKYESVPNDPLKARIYTLDNGLKVYMTVNKETPRIQTYIAVRVGGKNDPAETTGLAHVRLLMRQNARLFIIRSTVFLMRLRNWQFRTNMIN